MSQYCKNCGSRLNGGESYCPRCQKPTGLARPPDPSPKSQRRSSDSITEISAEVNRRDWKLAHSDGKGKIMKSYACAFQNYTNFSGRASRAEFWWLQLAIALFSVPGLFCLLVAALFGLLQSFRLAGGILMLIADLATIAFILPLVACAVRRLHDTGRSGWFLMLVFIPIWGWIPLLTMLLLPSQIGENKYGHSLLTF